MECDLNMLWGGHTVHWGNRSSSKIQTSWGCLGLVNGNTWEILDVLGLLEMYWKYWMYGDWSWGSLGLKYHVSKTTRRTNWPDLSGTYWDLKDLKDFTGFFAGEKHKKWMSPTAKTPEIQCVIHWGYTRGISRVICAMVKVQGTNVFWWTSMVKFMAISQGGPLARTISILRVSFERFESLCWLILIYKPI